MRLPRPGNWTWLLPALALLGGIFLYLVPPGSTPVGWDAWWNLVVSRAWAEGGFPQAFPAAAYTMLEERYAEYQLALQALLVVVGGRQIGPGLVPPLVWLLALAQGAVFWLCLRRLRPGASPGWLLLPAALSATWLFRATALRGMMLTLLFLLPLVTLLVERARGRRGRAGLLGIFLLAALVAYSHSALALPLVLVALLLVGARLQRGPLLLPEALAVLAGFALANLARPDFPANLELLWNLNVRLPWADLTGAIAAVPVELRPFGFGELLLWNTPFLLALGLVAWRLRRAPRPWALLLPVLFLALAALASRRMFETAAPFLALLLAFLLDERRHRRLALVVGTVALLALPWQIRQAQVSARANRPDRLGNAAHWIQERARPGDLVFLTDYALTGPLAWHTRGSGLRFTGWRDPAWMLAWNEEAWREWRRIKSAAEPAPEKTLRDFFQARFLVYHRLDALPGRPPGETAKYLGRMAYRLSSQGSSLDGQAFGPWICLRLPW